MRVIAFTQWPLTRAERAYWTYFPNLEEYDAVIVDMNSIFHLNIEKYLNEGHFLRFANQIGTLLRTGRSIYCIMKPICDTQGKELPHNVPGITNYSWLNLVNVMIKLRYESGTSIKVQDDKFKRYFEEVDKWDYEISMDSSPLILSDRSLAINKSGASLAMELVLLTRLPETKDDKVDELGSIYLLPSPTRCTVAEAIEILLDIILGEERSRYDWWNHIEILGTDEIVKQVSHIDDEISKLKQQRLSASKQLEQLYGYRDLLSADGDTLVNVVRRTLEDIGISTQKIQPGAHVDLIAQNIAIEVTGTTDKINFKNPKLIQLLQYHDESPDMKLILIANTYKRENPFTRRDKEHFTSAALKALKSIGVCCMTSQTLFELWRLAKTQPSKKDAIKKSIYETEGELRELP